MLDWPVLGAAHSPGLSHQAVVSLRQEVDQSLENGSRAVSARSQKLPRALGCHLPLTQVHIHTQVCCCIHTEVRRMKQHTAAQLNENIFLSLSRIYFWHVALTSSQNNWIFLPRNTVFPHHLCILLFHLKGVTHVHINQNHMKTEDFTFFPISSATSTPWSWMFFGPTCVNCKSPNTGLFVLHSCQNEPRWWFWKTDHPDRNLLLVHESL